jgi:hypothetical protein
MLVVGACDDGGELADYDVDREEQGGTAPDGAAPAAPFGAEPGAAAGEGFSPADPGSGEGSSPADPGSGEGSSPADPGSGEGSSPADPGSGGTDGGASGGADVPLTPPPTDPVPVAPDAVETPAEGGGETGRANPLEGGVGGGIDTTS